MYKCIPLLIFSLCTWTSAYCQESSVLDYLTKEIGFNVKKPPGFKEVAPARMAYPGSIAIRYELQAKAHEVAIGIAPLHLEPINDSLLTRFTSNASKNDSYLNSIRNMTDSVFDHLTFLTQKEALKRYNADNVIEFSPTTIPLYKNKYPRCKIIWLHKKDICDIQKTDKLDLNVYYFYNSSYDSKIEEMIEEASNLIRFD